MNRLPGISHIAYVSAEALTPHITLQAIARCQWASLLGFLLFRSTSALRFAKRKRSLTTTARSKRLRWLSTLLKTCHRAIFALWWQVWMGSNISSEQRRHLSLLLKRNKPRACLMATPTPQNTRFPTQIVWLWYRFRAKIPRFCNFLGVFVTASNFLAFSERLKIKQLRKSYRCYKCYNEKGLARARNKNFSDATFS